jgi:molybdate transport system substrate-binding protein
VPGKYHTPIRYYVATTATDQAKKDAVNAFNKYLKTKPATAKLKAAGFGIVK